MKESLVKLTWITIISSLAFIGLGLLLLFNPENTINTTSYVLGGMLLLLGVIFSIRYFRRKEYFSYLNMDLICGICFIILGIVLILKPKGLASIIPIMLGMWIIVNSIVKLQYAMYLKTQNISTWATAFTLSIVTLICGLFLIFNPIKSAILLTQVIGGFIIMYGVLDIIDVIVLRKNAKKVKEMIIKTIEE